MVHAAQVAEQITSSGSHVEVQPVDMGLLVMKELGAKWLEDMYEHICDNPQFIVNGFLQAGIPQALDGKFDSTNDDNSVNDSNNDITNNETIDSDDESYDSSSDQNASIVPKDVIKLLDSDSNDL